jgi:hypothetical protein
VAGGGGATPGYPLLTLFHHFALPVYITRKIVISESLVIKLELAATALTLVLLGGPAMALVVVLDMGRLDGPLTDHVITGLFVAFFLTTFVIR